MKNITNLPPCIELLPVLLITYQRIECVQASLSLLKRIGCKNVMIFSDGPKIDNETSQKRVKNLRKFLKKEVLDFENGELILSENNLGCCNGPIQAITDFFNVYPYGVIIEDDIVITETYLHASNILLHIYQDDHSIFQIGGYQPCNFSNSAKEFYFFKSRLIPCWGWATWRSRWKKFVDLENPKIEELHCDYFGRHSKKIEKELKASWFDDSVWDGRWVSICLLNHGYSILPSQSLTANIGFGIDSTHTRRITPLSRVKAVNYKPLNLLCEFSKCQIQPIDRNRDIAILDRYNQRYTIKSLAYTIYYYAKQLLTYLATLIVGKSNVL